MFSQHAPAYWAKNIPVMPLRPAQKVPSLPNWAIYAAQMPSPEEQERWLRAFPDGNIGLPLGPQSRMVALDLDSEDPRVLEMLLRLMPQQLWKRVGKKGAVFAFRYNGERTYRIKDEDGKTIFELLSRGAQVVLPPSIHPETQRPYVANCDLLDVIDRLPCLPTDFEAMARQALIDMGFKLTSRGATKITEWTPAGGRDSAMVSHAGLLSRAVLRGERTLMEALNEIETWVMTYTERVTGDLLDPGKAKQKVMEFVRRDIVEGNKILPPNWAVGMTPEEKAECRKYFGDEVEEWTRQQLMDWLQAKFSEIPADAVSDRKDAIDEALMRVSKSPNLDHLDVEMVLAFITNASGRLVALTSLRKRLKELQSTGMKGEDHSEIAEGLIKELEREGEVRFCHDTFYRWGGSHWVTLLPSYLMSIISREFGHFPAARKRNDHRGILQVAGDLAAQPLCTFDTPGINFANGYLTADLELRDHEPSFGATYVMPYRYVPDVAAPNMLMSLLDQSWGEDHDYLEKVQALREAMAATMFGLASRFAQAICLYGLPHSGKTVIMDVMKGMVPADAYSVVSPHDWADKFMPTHMLGKLINFCGEISETQTIEGDRFKMVVEGAEIQGQYKGGQIFMFKPVCAQWFATNHLPRTRDTSAGFTRRWLFLTFDKQCSEDQKRTDLAMEILAEEREAIAAWAIPAVVDLLRRQAYTTPSSHVDQLGEIANLNNSVRYFMKSSYVLTQVGVSIPEDDFYRHYNFFCRMIAHVQPMAMTRFKTVMRTLQRELGFENRVNRYFGVSVPPPKTSAR